MRYDRSFQSPVGTEEERNFLPKEKSTFVLLKEKPLQMHQGLFQKECDFPVSQSGRLVAVLESEIDKINVSYNARKDICK